MAVPAIMKTVLESIVGDSLNRTIRSVWKKMPWAVDRAKEQFVEQQMSQLGLRVGDIVRNVGAEQAPNMMRAEFERFEKALVDHGIPAPDAAAIRKETEAQIDRSVIQPLLDVKRLQTRLADLEASERRLSDENAQQAQAISDLSQQVGFHRTGLIVIGLLSLIAFLVALRG